MIYNEDCIETMRRMAPNSVDLVVTSPPYAGKRSDQYPAPTVDGYIDWFLPIAREIRRILKPDGSFLLNIKEGAHKGERQIYVMELVLAMRLQGWRWVDEYAWIKSNPIPGWFPDRFKDGWERIHHFAGAGQIKFYPNRVRKPLVPHSQYIHDTPPPSEQGNYNRNSSTGSGIAKNSTRFRRHNSALPSNVLQVNLGKNNMAKHAATFPAAIPEFFIKVFSDKGDLIYDPFMGSGTTAAAARDLGRKWIGSEISAEYYKLIQERMAPPRPPEGQEILA